MFVRVQRPTVAKGYMPLGILISVGGAGGSHQCHSHAFSLQNHQDHSGQVEYDVGDDNEAIFLSCI